MTDEQLAKIKEAARDEALEEAAKQSISYRKVAQFTIRTAP